jgi:hypothetical protein
VILLWGFVLLLFVCGGAHAGLHQVNCKLNIYFHANAATQYPEQADNQIEVTVYLSVSDKSHLE